MSTQHFDSYDTALILICDRAINTVLKYHNFHTSVSTKIQQVVNSINVNVINVRITNLKLLIPALFDRMVPENIFTWYFISITGTCFFFHSRFAWSQKRRKHGE